jgi:hypothetical protein
MAETRLGTIEGQLKMEVTENIWTFDEDDWLLIAMLHDPIFMSELLFEDPNRRDYGGCYHVDFHQYPLFRPPSLESGFPCGRGIGKTESIKARAVSHAFRRVGQDMLITAPEMIHLSPLTEAIEARIRDTRLTREFLDTRNQKTGFTHKPFQCDFLDGTKIIGRIPKITGTGVKGQHVTDLIIDEGQDYPEKGWIEVFPTVMQDWTGPDGEPDYTFTFYGVHSGVRDSKFYDLSKPESSFTVHTVTQVMKGAWSAREKQNAASMYGGTNTPDYKRNVLGEAGGAGSAFFVTSRLMACIDQDKDSDYNTLEFKRQKLEAEELDVMVGDLQGRDRDEMYLEILRQMVDLPDLPGVQQLYLGGDIGLVNDPTVYTLWAVDGHKGKSRLKLVRMFHLFRFREKQIRQVLYLIGWKYGQRLRSAGLDITGLGLPIFQGMQDDEIAPQHLIEVTQGFVFNAKVPVGIDPSLVSQDSAGNLRDQYGSIVEVIEDEFTGAKRYVVRMTMIEASTRYLRDWVDSTYLLLPFDSEIAGDFQAETTSRVKAMAGVRKKPSAFHILDSARAFAMGFRQADVTQQLAVQEQTPVLARAITSGVTAGTR